ncbi:glycosyltransferase [Oscillatoria laete-virens NRMC-F 0139]|nr:glycosyltransferase [Oscillatoria laete-virens NRMC-F 0139]
MTDTVFVTEGYPHLKVDVNPFLRRLRITRFHKWVQDWKNLVWPLFIPRTVHRLVEEYRPDVILTVADNSLSMMALRVARKYKIPLVGLFLDWFPIMRGHYGHKWTREIMSDRFRELYHLCQFAICTSEGMREELGDHPCVEVIYPMPAVATAKELFPVSQLKKKVRILYTGSIENFYGRMLCRLIQETLKRDDVELRIVGPNPDWPDEILNMAKEKGIYLGFKKSNELDDLFEASDCLLSVMSFEKEHRLFMETSFTTKYLDYSARSKPMIIWAPDYSSPAKFTRLHDSAILVDQDDATLVIERAQEVCRDSGLWQHYSRKAKEIRSGPFNPDKLQEKLKSGVMNLIGGKA